MLLNVGDVVEKAMGSENERTVQSCLGMLYFLKEHKLSDPNLKSIEGEA